MAAAANFINGRNGIAVRRRDEGSDPSAACGRCSGENGAALPVADIASRFQGSAPFSGHEGAHWTDGTTRANAVTKFWAPQQDHAALRNGLVNAVGADAHIGPHEMVRKMCVGVGFYPARQHIDCAITHLPPNFHNVNRQILDTVPVSRYDKIWENSLRGSLIMAERLTPRKQQALEMRSRIQNVALDLFDREGFENVSVEEIAQKAGCSVGNIYHYFKSKDELAIQVTSHVDAAYLTLEAEYLADSTRTSREKLLDFVGQSLRISSSDPVLYKAFIHAMKYPEQGALQRNEHRIYFRVLLELVELCRRDGFIDARYDGDMAVEYLVTLHRGTLLEWRIYEGNFDIAQRGIAMAEILLRGWGKYE